MSEYKGSCVYLIMNHTNNKIYIGSAVDFSQRKAVHISTLNNKKHANRHLQSSWLKNGSANFTFNILKYIEDKKILISSEQEWMDYLKPEYNINILAASRLGTKISEETRKKMSVPRSRESVLKGMATRAKNPLRYWLGKKRSPEDIEKMRIAQLGKTGYWKGKKLSSEHKQKMRLKKLGVKGIGMSGKTHAQTTKMKIINKMKQNRESGLYQNIRGTMIQYDGQLNNLATWSKIYNIGIATLSWRYKNKYPLEKVFSVSHLQTDKRIKEQNKEDK